MTKGARQKHHNETKHKTKMGEPPPRQSKKRNNKWNGEACYLKQTRGTVEQTIPPIG